MRRIKIIFTVMILIGLAGGCTPVESQTNPNSSNGIQLSEIPEPDYWPTDGWRMATPESQGMDSHILAEMYDYIRENQVSLHSLLIVRNGYIVTEAYFDPHQAEIPHEIASLTKSVIGSLIGIAIDQGHIKDVNRPVVDFFKDFKIDNFDARKEGITLHDLLTLAPGLDCSDQAGTEALMTQSKVWIEFVLDLPMATAPGEQWTYCSSAVHVLSAVLQQATGQDARTFANENLFKPLGAVEIPIENWKSDPQGVTLGGQGLLLTSRDLAKYAFLYLHEGKWDGKQVISPEWITASLKPYFELGVDPDFSQRPRSYGYLWSVFPELNRFSAFGMGGQQIHVFPDKNLIVIYTAAVKDNLHLDMLLENFILPAVLSEGSLLDDPAGDESLEVAIQSSTRNPQPVGSLSGMAEQISGITYKLDSNPMHWDTWQLTFEPDSDTAGLSINGQSALPVGLDNIYRVTALSEGPTLGLKGTWTDNNEFTLNAMYLGTFTNSIIQMMFEGERLMLSIDNIVLGGQPLVLQAQAVP